MLLDAVVQVFEDFRYTDHTETGDTATLAFSARVGDRELDGIDLLRFDADGKVREMAVYVRPMSGRQRPRRGDAAEARGARRQLSAWRQAPEPAQARSWPSWAFSCQDRVVAGSRAGSRARTGRRRGRRAPPRRSRARCRRSLPLRIAERARRRCSRTGARGRCRRRRRAATGSSERPSIVRPALRRSARTIVGARSTLLTGCCRTAPAGKPGPRITSGTRGRLLVQVVLEQQPVRAQLQAVVRGEEDVGLAQVAGLAQPADDAA